MGRGPKPAKSKAKPPVVRKAPKNDATRVRDLEKRLAEGLKDKAEALEQQTATADILRVISRSPSDIEPVFDAIVQNAVKLCAGLFGTVLRLDGDRLHLAAHHNLSPAGLQAYREHYPVVVNLRETVASGAILDRRVVQVIDSTDPAVPPRSVAMARATGFRGIVVVPMLRDGEPIGVINVARQERGPFTDRQVALLQTFADQAVIAIENVRLFNETKEALEQQTATSEILRVISQTPTDVGPVFDAILASSTRLCEADYGILFLAEADGFRAVAFRNVQAEFAAVLAAFRQFGAKTGMGRLARDKRPVHIPDVLDDDAYREGEPTRLATINIGGVRTWLGVPLLNADVLIGAIVIYRKEQRPFTDKQIALLKTFADQAVIAIENVRLFNETKEALEQQTATADILKVISSSPTDVQPVFDTIAERAVRLCNGLLGGVYRFDGELIHFVAHHNWTAEGLETVQRVYPRVPSRETQVSAAILGGAVVEVRDFDAPGVSLSSVPLARALGYRSILAIPMLRQGKPIGAIAVARAETGPFSPKEIELLQTFADQAVIAIENVRLFKELQEKNEALTQAHAQVTEALEQQTATSEILRTITHSQTDVQPVFDTIVQSGARLCHASVAAVFLTDGRTVYHPANHGGSPEALAAVRARFPRPLDMDSTPGMAILTRSVVHIPDSEDPSVPEHVMHVAAALGFRSVLTVPMLRESEAVGAITVARREPGRFSDAEVELLKTFADQAVIAIVNVRLFKELQARTHDLTRSVGELRALGEIGQAISSTLDLQTVLSTIVMRATQLSGTDAGVIYEYEEQRQVFVPRATEHLEAEIVETMLATPVRKGEGATGRLAEVQEPVQVPDILAAPAESRVRGALVRAGYRALLAVPLIREGHLIGGLTVIRKATGVFAPEDIELLQTFATQSALAIQNARLFREIEEKSHQLEVASQHKSEFLANMSHELRTPLNAIIGFSEVLADRMFGDLNEKQEEYLKDIYASGTHLLSLINDILDLSKIEAGRMELELTDFDLPTALDNALMLVRERAGRRTITLQMSVDERVGEVRADERKIRQVVLNLLSNAIKFTPEGGRIEVGAVPKEGFVEVSVSDTGVGIAPEDQEAVFEEFRQVGAAEKKAEGTGLGLTLCRRFIELHGGRIRVQSEVGRGSTFTFTIPVRRGE